jgi:hypothetical protein
LRDPLFKHSAARTYMVPPDDVDLAAAPEFRKVAGDGKDYSFDWTDWCASEDTEIFSMELTVHPSLTKVLEQRDGKLMTVVVDDGVAGYVYPIRCRVVTTRTPLLEATRTMYIRVVAEQ